mmetsp:Transcript_3929/g.8305  ORF Transcript_3929/g.8305 Transcript_3929/m.8305 type:complete len:113 (-) Transcript_3929:2435-2773(-)
MPSRYTSLLSLLPQQARPTPRDTNYFSNHGTYPSYASYRQVDMISLCLSLEVHLSQKEVAMQNSAHDIGMKQKYECFMQQQHTSSNDDDVSFDNFASSSDRLAEVLHRRRRL